MRFRFSMMCALGLAAALTVVDASDSYVQAQTPADSAARRAAARRAAARRAAARRAAAARARSEQAIPTTGKEPIQPTVRVDTVYQVRSDTVFRMRTDTVTMFPAVRMGGFYWGLGGGLTAPRQDLNTTFEPGFNITALLGWDPIGSPFGVRLDGTYDQFSERSEFAGLAADPQIFTVNLDGKLRFPIYGVETGGRAHLYAVGGGSYFTYKNLYWAPEGTECCGGVDQSENDGDWHDKFGWNLGGGFGFGFGPSDIFLEARWMGIGDERSFVPIILGLTF
jgi:hypothetical protein